MAAKAETTQKELQSLVQDLLENDKARRTDPIRGRAADEAMIRLCQFLKDQRRRLPQATFDQTIKTLKGLKLMPYWNYCREHMLDIGLEF